MTSEEHRAAKAAAIRAWRCACREQRQAYLAWLNAPVGPAWIQALQEYRDASDRMEQAERRMDDGYVEHGPLA